MEKTKLSVSDVKCYNQPLIEFDSDGHDLIKTTSVGPLQGTQRLGISKLVDNSLSKAQLAKLWGIETLRSRRIPKVCPTSEKVLNLADFFCGSGGLSLGIKDALESVGLGINHMIACDISKDSLDVYNANFKPKERFLDNAANLLQIGKTELIGEYRIPVLEDIQFSPELKPFINQIDIFAAGPPCQGNSNLNNKTRRDDPRNDYYISAALIGAKLGAEIIIIENVQTVKSSKQNVVEIAKIILGKAGYGIENSEYMLKAEEFNVPQKRIRHFLIAVKNRYAKEPIDYSGLITSPLSAMDAIEDLENISSNNLMDMPATLSKENLERINFLFDNEIYNLPDSERPYCHREKAHTYNNVYGRMFPSEPAYTITTGFQSPGRGRFIHPKQRRGLTPREGARLQSFPDYFKWQTPLCRVSKQSITRLIGDAVPPNLGQVAMLIALSSCRTYR